MQQLERMLLLAETTQDRVPHATNGCRFDEMVVFQIAGLRSLLGYNIIPGTQHEYHLSVKVLFFHCPFSDLNQSLPLLLLLDSRRLVENNFLTSIKLSKIQLITVQMYYTYYIICHFFLIVY